MLNSTPHQTDKRTHTRLRVKAFPFHYTTTSAGGGSSGKSACVRAIADLYRRECAAFRFCEHLYGAHRVHRPPMASPLAPFSDGFYRTRHTVGFVNFGPFGAVGRNATANFYRSSAAFRRNVQRLFNLVYLNAITFVRTLHALSERRR